MPARRAARLRPARPPRAQVRVATSSAPARERSARSTRSSSSRSIASQIASGSNGASSTGPSAPNVSRIEGTSRSTTGRPQAIISVGTSEGFVIDRHRPTAALAYAWASLSGPMTPRSRYLKGIRILRASPNIAISTFGPPALELLERQQAERHRAPRRDRAGVEEHEVVAPVRRQRRVGLVVDAEVERRRLDPVALAQQARKPRRGGDRVQPERVGLLGPHALARSWRRTRARGPGRGRPARRRLRAAARGGPSATRSPGRRRRRSTRRSPAAPAWRRGRRSCATGRRRRRRDGGPPRPRPRSWLRGRAPRGRGRGRRSSCGRRCRGGTAARRRRPAATRPGVAPLSGAAPERWYSSSARGIGTRIGGAGAALEERHQRPRSLRTNASAWRPSHVWRARLACAMPGSALTALELRRVARELQALLQVRRRTARCRRAGRPSSPAERASRRAAARRGDALQRERHELRRLLPVGPAARGRQRVAAQLVQQPAVAGEQVELARGAALVVPVDEQRVARRARCTRRGR